MLSWQGFSIWSAVRLVAGAPGSLSPYPETEMIRRWTANLLLCGLLFGCVWPNTTIAQTKTFAESISTVDSFSDLPPVTRLPPVLELSPSSIPIDNEPVSPSTRYFRWRDHSFSGGYQVGWLSGDPIGHGNSDVPNGPMVAKRYGWDFADNWGLEVRLADAWLGESHRFNPAKQQTEGILFGDMSLLYYPLGNTRLRPYATLGGGVADFKIANDQNEKVHRLLANVPFGVGVKYPLNGWLVLRAELLDGVCIGGDGLPTLNNVSLTGGVEVRFGDPRKHLMPWRKQDADASSATTP
jgi:hypothetical protein